MKKILFVLIILICQTIQSYTQLLDINNPPKLITATENRNGISKRIYEIECIFTKPLSATDKVEVKKSRQWNVKGVKKNYNVSDVVMNLADSNKCFLKGDWDIFDELSIAFIDQQGLNVSSDSICGTTNWGFGKGKAFELNARRLSAQKAMYAFDYGFTSKIVELNLSSGGQWLWMHTLTFNIDSKGTFGSDNEVQNGTQSSLSLSLNPYYFVGGIIYGAKIEVGYQIETKMNGVENKLFNIIDKKLKFGIQLELPWSNYPMYKLHSITGYSRLAMPLTINVDYLPKGKNDAGDETLARSEIMVRYELAFSPYLIIQGELQKSLFSDPPIGIDKDASYFSLSLAQDLDAVKTSLGFLKIILGDNEEIRDKHFIFYKISHGKRAPAFQDINEQSIGFGTYF